MRSRQRLAFDEFQDETADAGILDDAVDRRDVGVAERRQQPRLTLEPRDPIGAAGDLGRKDLDGDVAAEPRVVGAIDLAHAAAPQQ